MDLITYLDFAFKMPWFQMVFAVCLLFSVYVHVHFQVQFRYRWRQREKIPLNSLSMWTIGVITIFANWMFCVSFCIVFNWTEISTNFCKDLFNRKHSTRKWCGSLFKIQFESTVVAQFFVTPKIRMFNKIKERICSHLLLEIEREINKFEIKLQNESQTQRETKMKPPSYQSTLKQLRMTFRCA